MIDATDIKFELNDDGKGEIRTLTDEGSDLLNDIYSKVSKTSKDLEPESVNDFIFRLITLDDDLLPGFVRDHLDGDISAYGTNKLVYLCNNPELIPGYPTTLS